VNHTPSTALGHNAITNGLLHNSGKVIACDRITPLTRVNLVSGFDATALAARSHPAPTEGQQNPNRACN
jgi:hypothetical protein